MAKSIAAISLPLSLRNIAKSDFEGIQPNILWITMEDTCPQIIGCYGNKEAGTPNMDDLAAIGV